jgi:hypothetical protein
MQSLFHRWKHPVALAVLGLALLLSAAHAQTSPTLIPFQGRLTDQQGNPYNTGQYTIVFQLYDQPVGGTLLWSERHEKVGVLNGMVNVFLGSIAPLAGVDFSQTRHLGITIDVDNNPNTPDSEMVPRQMIIPAFWAKNSDKLAGHDWSSLLVNGNNPASGKIRGDKIQDGGIGSVHIASGAVNSAHLAIGSITSSAIADGTIASQDLADGAVTFEKLASRAVSSDAPVHGVALSPAVPDREYTGTAIREVPELTVTLATSGRPVIVFLTAAGHAETSLPNVTASALGSLRNGTPYTTSYVRITRDGVHLVTQVLQSPASSGAGIKVPPGCIQFIDTPPAGTHTYKIYVFCYDDLDTIQLRHVRLAAFEL